MWTSGGIEESFCKVALVERGGGSDNLRFETASPSVDTECYGLNNPGFSPRHRQDISVLQEVRAYSGSNVTSSLMNSGDLPGDEVDRGRS